MGRVRIGHASIAETGGINGKKGDQTKREVCIRDYYNKNWTCVLRPKHPSLAESSAKACELLCANNNIGYGQNDRNSLYNEWKRTHDISKIGKCNTDCSAFMTLCAIIGGCVELNYTINAPTTSTMRRAFSATEKYQVLTDKKYLTSSAYLKRGDILVSEGHHTVMVLDSGKEVSPHKNQPIYYPQYIGNQTSIVNALQSLQIDSNFNCRKRIAKANGYLSYTGTAAENTALLGLLKKGLLKRPTN